MKFNASELLESITREFSLDEIYEIYKALIAYSIGLKEITKEDEIKLEKVIDFYKDTNYIYNIINQEDVIDFANEIF